VPYELRRLAAFDAGALSAIGRIFVEAVFAHYRTCTSTSSTFTKSDSWTFDGRFGNKLGGYVDDCP
jgi:hypothetical protein